MISNCASKDAAKLSGGGGQVGRVVQHVRRQQPIDRIGRNRERAHVTDERRRVPLCLTSHAQREVDADELIDHFSKGDRHQSRTATEIDRVFEIGWLLMRLACGQHRLKQH